MSSKHDRFKNLEKSREAPGEPAPTLQSGGRFGAVDPNASGVMGSSQASGHMERFRDPVPGLESPEELEKPVMRRCVKCEAENSAWATSCVSCQVPLETDEQRAFEAQQLEERAKQLEAEQAKLPQMSATRAAAEAQQILTREEQERMVRELLQSERRRLRLSLNEPLRAMGRRQLPVWVAAVLNLLTIFLTPRGSPFRLVNGVILLGIIGWAAMMAWEDRR